MVSCMPMVSISVVSHAQIQLIEGLLQDLESNNLRSSIEVILTLNVTEELPFDQKTFSFPITVIYNANPMGFAANHNQAFAKSKGQLFCVVNPDIRLKGEVFSVLDKCLKDVSIGVAAPMVLNSSGTIEDSARRFPTPLKILCKALGGCQGGDYLVKDAVLFPDWVGGMFMLFRREVFQKIGGFDQHYFLYYEDVDLCARLKLQGYKVALCPDASVIHHAQRSSHHNLKYLRWNLSSMLRFFISMPFFKIIWSRLMRASL